MNKPPRYFVENVTNLENRYLVDNDRGYSKREDAEARRNALAEKFPENVYTVYVRGGRTQHN